MTPTRADRDIVGPLAVGLLAVVFGGAAAWNLAHELSTLQATVPPLVVFALGFGGALVLGYGAVRLARASLPPDDSRLVGYWTVSGATVMAVVTAVTIVVRVAEGRVVSEPQLLFVVNGTAGAIGGLLAGSFHVRARRRAAEAARTRDAMSFLNSTLRHELLNDVSVVKGFASDRPDYLDAAHDHLAVVEDQADEMESVVRDIRDVARAIETGESFEPVDVAALLRDEAAAVRRASPDAEVSVDAPDDLRVLANPALSHVFGNIIENAVEHNDADTPRVFVEATATNGTVRVDVADNGSGIPTDEESVVFEKHTGDDHGFGLYLVETLVEEFGGNIQVDDSECGGAAFTVELRPANRG